MPKVVFDFDQEEFRHVAILDRNGNLTLIEYEDGSINWVSNHEVEQHRD